MIKVKSAFLRKVACTAASVLLAAVVLTACSEVPVYPNNGTGTGSGTGTSTSTNGGNTTGTNTNTSTKPTAAPTATPAATPTTKPTATPTVTPAATPTATPATKPTATPTPKPTATPTPTPTPTAKPTAMPTPTPTATPTPTPTPTTSEVKRPDTASKSLFLNALKTNGIEGVKYNSTLEAKAVVALTQASKQAEKNDLDIYGFQNAVCDEMMDQLDNGGTGESAYMTTVIRTTYNGTVSDSVVAQGVAKGAVKDLKYYTDDMKWDVALSSVGYSFMNYKGRTVVVWYCNYTR